MSLDTVAGWTCGGISAVLVASLIATCVAPSSAQAESGGTAAYGLNLPESFRGDLPCADCEGVRYHLDLWPDQVFHLRREWLGRDTVRGDVGRWSIEPSRRALMLQGGAEMPLQFEILGQDRLRKLDLAGQPIISDLPYELRGDGTLDPVELSLFLGGEMTYTADSARFTECLTGRSYAIAPGDEALQLQRAYLADAREPGAPLYVSFEGTITRRPRMDSGVLESAVTVERFVGTWPNQACSRARADAVLVNTYWRIARMNGAAVLAAPNRREPHLLFRDSDGSETYAATVGCNQLTGSFEATGDQVSFEQSATTSQACPSPVADTERSLREVLKNARQWQIRGSVLELKDEAGRSIALFEAVYF